MLELGLVRAPKVRAVQDACFLTYLQILTTRCASYKGDKGNQLPLNAANLGMPELRLQVHSITCSTVQMQHRAAEDLLQPDTEETVAG